MAKVIFVIGATATGKTHFINKHFASEDYEILNLYDYQNRLYSEALKDKYAQEFSQYNILFKANMMILEDILDKLSSGKSLVVEHTLFKAKRRISYIDEIKKIKHVQIDVYVMNPSEESWDLYIKSRELEDVMDNLKKGAEYFEFPNPAEGFDMIYEVIGEKIKERMESPKSEIIEQARAELKAELEVFTKIEKEKADEKELLESMNSRKFWHYCEVCGKKEFITADMAYDTGWDYPPKMGTFGILGPRTCGNCLIDETLFWRVSRSSVRTIDEDFLWPGEIETWKRIKNEPKSLLDEE